MAIRAVRLGTARHPNEGLCIGTVRHVPRGVLKKDYARRNYFDVWLPELAPTARLVSWYFSRPLTAKHWNDYTHRYRKGMQKPAARRLIELLDALSSQTNFLGGLLLRRRKPLPQIIIKAASTRARREGHLKNNARPGSREGAACCAATRPFIEKRHRRANCRPATLAWQGCL
ncbi:MAG TPA: DUF488 family protein [Candidatus Binatia bacterium]